MRDDLGRLALPVEREQVVQPQAGAGPGQDDNQQVPADNQYAHGCESEQHGADKPQLARLSIQVARGIIDNDPAEHGDQQSHRQPH